MQVQSTINKMKTISSTLLSAIVSARVSVGSSSGDKKIREASLDSVLKACSTSSVPPVKKRVDSVRHLLLSRGMKKVVAAAPFMPSGEEEEGRKGENGTSSAEDDHSLSLPSSSSSSSIRCSLTGASLDMDEFCVEVKAASAKQPKSSSSSSQSGSAADAVVVRASFEHFFNVMWYCTRLEYAIRFMARCWFEDHGRMIADGRRARRGGKTDPETGKKAPQDDDGDADEDGEEDEEEYEFY